jgi:hypothetical protein
MREVPRDGPQAAVVVEVEVVEGGCGLSASLVRTA